MEPASTDGYLPKCAAAVEATCIATIGNRVCLLVLVLAAVLPMRVVAMLHAHQGSSACTSMAVAHRHTDTQTHRHTDTVFTFSSFMA